MNIYLKLMSDEMYHQYFKEYENDPCLYLNQDDYFTYVYDEDKVNNYIQKQRTLNRVTLAIMDNNVMIGEIKLYDITSTSVTLGISMKNDLYKNKGYGTIAEKLVIDYVFNQLNLTELYANSIITNTRSQHVLEKAGFHKINEDEKYIYYKVSKGN